MTVAFSLACKEAACVACSSVLCCCCLACASRRRCALACDKEAKHVQGGWGQGQGLMVRTLKAEMRSVGAQIR
jgi:hypothetical protein